jgi:hypothetical protein
MITNSPNSKREPRIRYHLSEGTAAELNHSRRKSAHSSWDEFFVAMLAKWNGTEFQPKSHLEAQYTAVTQELQKLTATLIKIQTGMEIQGEFIQSIEQGQEQICDLMRKINLLLALALEVSDTDQPEAISEQPKTPSVRNDIINKIRRRS